MQLYHAKNHLLTNNNLLQNIFSYLPLHDIIHFSFTSKANYSLIHLNNTYINLLWLKQCENTFYDSITSPLQAQTLPLESINNCNWKCLYILLTNSKDESNCIIGHSLTQTVFDAFYLHQYLPKLRKHNNILETMYMSLHQEYYLEHDNDVNDNIESSIIKDYTIETSFMNVVNSNNNNDIQTQIIFDIIKYKLTNNHIVCVLNDYKKYNFIIVILTIVYKITKLICIFHINRLKYILDNNNNKVFINEYVDSHNAFVNSALIINDKFNEISKIVSKCIKEKFTLYDMMFHIWKHEVFDKIENDLYRSIQLTTSEFINELIEVNNDDYYYSEEITYKELFERIANCILDFSISDNNVKYINHTALSVGKEYVTFENIISKGIVNVFTTHNNVYNNIYHIERFVNEEINFIPHTKLTILNDVVSALKETFINHIEHEFNLYLNTSNTTTDTTSLSIYSNNDVIDVFNVSFEHDDTSSNIHIKNKIEEEFVMIYDYLQHHHHTVNKDNDVFDNAIVFIRKGRSNYVKAFKQLMSVYYERMFHFEEVNQDVLVNIANEKYKTFDEGYLLLNNTCGYKLSECNNIEEGYNTIIGLDLGLEMKMEENDKSKEILLK